MTFDEQVEAIKKLRELGVAEYESEEFHVKLYLQPPKVEGPEALDVIETIEEDPEVRKRLYSQYREKMQYWSS
jgi:hypothetical protein